MSQNNLITPNGIVAVIVSILTLASTAGTLGHWTSGHFLMYLSFVFGTLAIGLWVKQYKPDLIRILKVSSLLSKFKKPSPREYTQDIFWGAVWRWHYNIELEDELIPRDLKPYCPECNQPLVFIKEWQGKVISGGIKKGELQWLMQWDCPSHPEKRPWYNVPGKRNLFEVYNIIGKRIKDGSWEVAVKRQKKARISN